MWILLVAVLTYEEVAMLEKRKIAMAFHRKSGKAACGHTHQCGARGQWEFDK